MVAAIKRVIVVGTTHVESGTPGRPRPGHRQDPDDTVLPSRYGPSPIFLFGFSKAHVAQQVEHFLGKEEVHRFDPGRGLHMVPL